MNLKCDELLSSFAFNCNLRPSTPAPPVDDPALIALPGGDLVAAFVFRPLTVEAPDTAQGGEGAPGAPDDQLGVTAIAVSRLDGGSGRWSEPTVVARFANQVLLRPSLHYEAATEKLYLTFVFRSVGEDDSETRVVGPCSLTPG